MDSFLRAGARLALALVACLAFAACNVRRGAAQPFDVSARISSHWRELHTMCPDKNYTTCNGVDRNLWTAANSTQLQDFTFTRLGAWSTFKMVTFDGNGVRRTRGGDSWWIVLRDTQQAAKVSTRVFDEGDGTYTVAAVFMLPGNYTFWAWHYYSDCHGLQEPASTAYGTDLEAYHSHLHRQDHCYIGGRVRRPGVWLIEPHHQPPACLSQPSSSCPKPTTPAAPGAPGVVARSDMYMYRTNLTFHIADCCKPPVPAPKHRVSRMLFYGDSTVKNSWDLMVELARKPCRVDWRPRYLIESFISPLCAPHLPSTADAEPVMDALIKRCTSGLPLSALPIGVNTYDVQQYHPRSDLYNMSDFKYNDKYAREHVPPIPLPVPWEYTFVYVDGWGSRATWLVREVMNCTRPGDVLVFNLGPHYTRAFTFDGWRELVDGMVETFKAMMARTDVMIVMRTSFLTKEHVFRSYTHASGYVPQAHFQTDARRLLFDSYAESVWQPIGVHVWDVHSFSHLGDYKPFDIVHNDAISCWAQNLDMFDQFGCRP